MKFALVAIFLSSLIVPRIFAGETHDPRMRSYISPERLLAVFSNQQARVEKPEALLAKKHGQVCEIAFGKSVGTRLANSGSAPGLLLDFGRELHGGVQLGMSPNSKRGARVRLCFGESVSEALSRVGRGKGATNDHALRDFELPVPSFGTIEVGNTGFRFLLIELVDGGEIGFEFVRAVSLMRPMKAIGSFKSSDERLNRVYDVALRTLHLCCQDYLWDGIKRDRLVWMGDTHPETMALLNVFGKDGIIPDTLDYAAATTDPRTWMSSMPTYTLWWIRNLAEWYRYTGDIGYLGRHADYLEKTFDHVLTGMAPSGRWTSGSFLDWPTEHNHKAKADGTQALALMAATDCAFLADALGRSNMAAKARGMVQRIKSAAPFDPAGAKSSAALLALSGLMKPGEAYDSVLGRNGHRGVSTFYGYYMLEAMSEAGEHRRALDTVRDYWGAMLDVGATSFWEDFNIEWTNRCFRIDEMPVAGLKDIHGDYGDFCYRGFRHSLCHGWSCGPVSWCINHVLGIVPVETGCRRVKISPFLGDLDWAEGAMALPDGQAIKVKVSKKPDGSLAVEHRAPDWVEVVLDL